MSVLNEAQSNPTTVVPPPVEHYSSKSRRNPTPSAPIDPDLITPSNDSDSHPLKEGRLNAWAALLYFEIYRLINSIALLQKRPITLVDGISALRKCLQLMNVPFSENQPSLKQLLIPGWQKEMDRFMQRIKTGNGLKNKFSIFDAMRKQIRLVLYDVLSSWKYKETTFEQRDAELKALNIRLKHTEDALLKMKRFNVCQLMADFVCPDVQYYIENIGMIHKLVLYEHAQEFISLLQFLRRYVKETKDMQLFFHNHLRLLHFIASTNIITISDSKFHIMVSWLQYHKSSRFNILLPNTLMREIERQLNTCIKSKIRHVDTMDDFQIHPLHPPRTVFNMIRLLRNRSQERNRSEVIQSLLSCQPHTALSNESNVFIEWTWVWMQTRSAIRYGKLEEATTVIIRTAQHDTNMTTDTR